MRFFLLSLLAALSLLVACGPRYSPDTYATRAVQQANRVEQGVVIGVRQVRISAEGSTGAATGAAAGGVLGAQAPGSSIVSALGGVGGALVGGVFGKAAEHTVVDTTAFEYVVRTVKNELLSVTQRDREPLEIGQRVLVITGTQARVVADYTVPPDPPSPPPVAPAPPAETPAGEAPAPAARPVPPEAGPAPGVAPEGAAPEPATQEFPAAAGQAATLVPAGLAPAAAALPALTVP